MDMDNTLKYLMIMDVAPGKKGCSTSFPWGGRMAVPPGLFNKKEKLIVKMVSATERHIHTPPLSEAERLVSEMVLLVARNYKFSKPVTLEIPCISENPKQRDIRVRTKLASEHYWTTIEEFIVDPKANCVKFETVSSGLFVVTSAPRMESFEVTPQGCLYNARINRYMSVRLPKKATDKTLNCVIKIQHVDPARVDLILNEFQNLCNDIIAISHFYDIQPDSEDDVTFRRAVSLKLPSTMCGEEGQDEPMETDEATENGVQGDMAILQKTSEGWKLVEQTLKFTQTSVSFDVKSLGRFCLVRHKPDRMHRLKLAMPTIEEMTLKLKGEILVSASLCEKSWRLLLDVTDKDLENDLATQRMENTWTRIEKEEVVTVNAENEPNENAPFRRRSRIMIPKVEVVEDPQTKPLNLFNGATYKLIISGDLKVLDGTPDERLFIQYHEKLKDNFTYFDIVPKPKESENGLPIPDGSRQHYSGCVSIFAHDNESNDEDKENNETNNKKEVLLRKFIVRYNQKQLDDYYYVEPEVEAKKKTAEVKEPVVVITKPKEEEVKPKAAPVMTPAMTRLTRPKQPPPKLLSKEPKVLSGRSLKVLSAAVEHGLTLAVHLNLPDSTITGLGFDSIANGLSMQAVTYKVLMLWKRTFKGTKEDQVKDLVESIKELGRVDISAVLMDRYRRDVELSPDCFDY